MVIKHANLCHQRIQLISNKSDAHFEGVLHEAIFSKFPPKFLNGITMEIVGGGDRNQDKNKFIKDAALLQKEVDKDPTNSRNVFYLAQSYRDCGEYQKAIYYYKQRILLGGWIEEVFYSQYQIGCCAEKLGQIEEAILNHLKAYEIRPTRSEPLFHLSVIYRQLSKHHLGYIFAQRGLVNSFPSDILFIEKSVYDYLLLFELSIHEYWVGDYDSAIDSCKQLMQIPNVPNSILKQNMKNIQFSYKKIRGV
jgi:tetratricopeptide (TPR) repeat protein